MSRKIIFTLLMVFILTCFIQGAFADEFTKLLIHSNTTNGSTTFEDSSENNHQISVNGDVHHDISQTKFGTTSIKFDGDGDYLSILDNADWNFGSGNFTIDFWVKFDSYLEKNSGFFVQFEDAGNLITFYLRNQSGVNYLHFYALEGGAIVTSPGASFGSAPENQWYHIALVRNGSVFTFYKDGVSLGGGVGYAAMPNFATPLYIGNGHNTLTQNYLDGHIDEFRVSKGIARWTANFTPPTAPYGLGKWYYEGYGIYTLDNVGIGTTNPQSALAVNGTVTSKKVVVTDTGWSDFVFDDGYDLPSLEKIESYIKENRHLPDIPSEKEIKENGLSLSDILAKQMQKIEELTLYIIQAKKKNEELRKRVNALEKKR